MISINIVLYNSIVFIKLGEILIRFIEKVSPTYCIQQ